MKLYTIFIIFGLLFLIIGCSATKPAVTIYKDANGNEISYDEYTALVNSESNNNVVPMNNDTNITILVGNDSDAYGCKISAGYSWCNLSNRCYRPSESNCTNIQEKFSNYSINPEKFSNYSINPAITLNNKTVFQINKTRCHDIICDSCKNNTQNCTLQCFVCD